MKEKEDIEGRFTNQDKPVFDKELLDKVIAKASVNLSKISDVDAWIKDLRGEGI